MEIFGNLWNTLLFLSFPIFALNYVIFDEMPKLNRHKMEILCNQEKSEVGLAPGFIYAVNGYMEL